jgi:putative tryptophan/tyrosine transport system substrate-binding protein
MTAARAVPFVIFVASMLTVLSTWADQGAKTHRIGVLSTTLGPSSPVGQAFRARLKELGYVEGQNIAIEVRAGLGGSDQLRGFVTELIQLRVDLIVTVGPYALEAAKNATGTIPIVFAGVGANFPGIRDAPNLTGIAEEIIDSTVQRLALLKEAVPAATRIAVLANPNNYGTQAYLQHCRTWAQGAGVSLHVYEVREPDDITRAFAKMIDDRVEGLIAFTDSIIFSQRDKIVETALKNRLPGGYPYREWVTSGGLLSYGPNLTTILRDSVPVMVDKILKGTKPSAIPIEQPKSEIFINLRTARALGLTIPQSLLSRADERVE